MNPLNCGMRTNGRCVAWARVCCFAATAVALDAVAPVRHHAALPYFGMEEFMRQLRSQAGMAARALESTILCATRTVETIGATWAEIDLAQKIWIIPAHRHEGKARAPDSTVWSRHRDSRKPQKGAERALGFRAARRQQWRHAGTTGPNGPRRRYDPRV